MKRTRTGFFKAIGTAGLGISALSAAPAPAAEIEQPNILIILADDLGYADLSVQGCRQFQTPNIDSIAENGVRFKEGYVSNSVCAPSRAGLLSGRIGIGFESNIPHNSKDGLRVSEKTIADYLKSAGYKTFCLGKWHLGYLPKFHPNQRGFDDFWGLLGGARSYYALEETDQHTAIEHNGKEVPEVRGSYLTDRLTDQAVERIEEHAEKTPDQPFFMYLSYTAPHGPLHEKPGTLDAFDHIKREKRQIYASMVVSLDDGVGRVLKTLEEQGILDHTMIVFLSDNGGPERKNASDNGVLKGTKGTLWEGGVRVPFMMQWPERIPDGQVLDGQVSSLDLLPTFAAAAGVEEPLKISGMDLMPFLAADAKPIPERDLLWRRGMTTQCALRSGKMKWVQNRRNEKEWLYNLEEDLSEEENLISEYPEIAEEMRKKYERWESTVPDPDFASGWRKKR